MTKGSQVTPEIAARRGWIEAGPVISVVRRWYGEQEDASKGNASPQHNSQLCSPARALSLTSGVSEHTIYKLLSLDSKRWLHFDLADKLITAIDVFLWMTDPALRRIYEGFDFGYLDGTKSRPAGAEKRRLQRAKDRAKLKAHREAVLAG